MKKYSPQKIEKKWQNTWHTALRSQINADGTQINAEKMQKNVDGQRDSASSQRGSAILVDKPKYYILDMFPYPSGDGLHMGHTESYTASDIIYRYKKLQGFDVLHPQGFDSFGLPAENYAIKTGVHPKKTTKTNSKNYVKQMKMLGFGHDLNHLVYTSDPSYYKWTQFLFGKFFENGLVQQKTDTINWCPSCNTGIANEQVENGKCERCKTEIEQKKIPGWFFKITDFAEELIDDLDTVDWPEHTKKNQRAWIGKSVGSKIRFSIISIGGADDNDGEVNNRQHFSRNDAERTQNYAENKKKDNFLYKELTYKIRGAIFNVKKQIGGGHKESVYHKALEIEFKKRGIFFESEKRIDVNYEGEKIGTYQPDFVINDKVIIELKALPKIGKQQLNQAWTYLKGSDYRLALLVNFSPSELEIKRMVYDTVRNKKTDSFSACSASVQHDSATSLEVFTTRPDTLFGCTYMVLAPEHDLIFNFKSQISNYNEVQKYIKQAQNKTELERVENKEKTGVELKGVKAINPANGEEIPVFVADYVLAGYGTGAIMAVPAHDERDFEFAKKYDLDIEQVIISKIDDYKITKKVLNVLGKIKKEADKENIKFWVLGGLACAFYAKIIYRAHDDLDLITKNKEDYKKIVEVFKKVGFKKIREKQISGSLTNTIFENEDKIEIDIGLYVGAFGLNDDDFGDKEKSIGHVKCKTLSKRFLISVKESQLKNRDLSKDKIDMGYLKGKIFVDNGYLVNSEKFDGMKSEEAKKAITEFVGGEMTSNYRLRDWSISRQRYWGCPIPIVYSPKGEAKFVGEKNLPWLLPEDVDFVPTGTAPLAKSKELKERTEKLFGKDWTPEVDTMDNFVDSSWYFLRYPDTENEKEFCSKEKLKKWLPVDLYIGGAEHTYMHLLYARFFVKAMKRIGLFEFNEPFLKLRHQGMVLDKDGVKMSKSKGNVINPNDMVEIFGADATRMYMIFAGPLEDEIAFKQEGAKGVYKFLEKTWRVFQEKELVICGAGRCGTVPKEIPPLFHKTIKKVTEDIESLSFNTAISQMMIFVNECVKHNVLPKVAMKKFLILLSPFAPHITEELWTQMGNEKSIFLEKWPEYDSKMIKDKTIEMVVQINGKVRDKIQVSIDISEEETKEKALASEKVQKFINNKEIKKVIFVKGRLISIVV